MRKKAKFSQGKNIMIAETDRQEQRRFFSEQFQKRIKKSRGYSPLKSSVARERAMYKLLMESFRDNSTVIWKSTFFPSEIIYAMDAVPLYIESFSAIASAVGLSTKILHASDKAGFSKDSCTFLRGVMGASNNNILPRPDALVSSSYYCDGDPKIFDIFAEKYKKPHFYLHVPYETDTEESIELLAEQLEEIAFNLARETGKEFSVDKLGEIIENSNEAYINLQKAMEIRKQAPSVVLGGEAIDYIAGISQLWGSKQLVRISNLLYEELAERAKNAYTPVEDEKYRLLWCHLRPYYNDDVFDYLELEHKAVIAFENVNLITWKEMDPQKPFRSLAEKLLTSPGIGRSERMTASISKMVSDYKIDGIIWMASWGCRHFNSLSQVVKADLRKEMDIPFFILDLECVDQTNYSGEQVRTRLDAFIEILAEKKQFAHIE